MKHTIEHKGYTAEIVVARDISLGPPWQENDCHGIVSEWTKCDKRPGEWLLQETKRGERLYYGFAATVKKAKQDGWGLSPEETDKLRKSLGRKPTRNQIVRRAVELDFKYLQAWCDDEWQWMEYRVNVTTPEGVQLDQESCGGFESEMAALEAGRAAAMKSIEIQMAEASKEFDAAHLAACADIFTV